MRVLIIWTWIILNQIFWIFIGQINNYFFLIVWLSCLPFSEIKRYFIFKWLFENVNACVWQNLRGHFIKVSQSCTCSSEADRSISCVLIFWFFFLRGNFNINVWLSILIQINVILWVPNRRDRVLSSFSSFKNFLVNFFSTR